MSITIVPQSIKRLFRVKNCPSEQQLAAYADQQLIGNERSRVEQHLAFCDVCLQQVGFLVRTVSISSEKTPDDVLRTAMNFRPKSAPITPYTWQWLAVASAVMVVVTLVGTWRKSQMHTTNDSPSSVTTAMNSGAEVRPTPSPSQASDYKVRGGQDSSDSILISPRPNETIDPHHLEFQWMAKDGASFYEIELVSDSGDVIWRKRSGAASLKLPANVHLQKGKTYYVWIRTHMARGLVEQSKAVRFTVG